MFSRNLDLSSILNRKSLFLLGPRQTGKTTFLKKTLPQAHFIDLLKMSTYQEFIKNPNLLSEIIEAQEQKTSIFVIDEIQKYPALLDEVHRLIELNKKLRFVLTGSSARKLKQQGVNLLGGRASRVLFHPINSSEYFSTRFKPLDYLLKFGGIPSILTSSAPKEELKDYIGLYLKEEIKNEGLVRSIENFSSFINAACHSQCEQLNFTEIGNDAQVPPRTIIDYFKILEDTLVAYLLPAYIGTKKRKAMTSAKFYFFDVGVGNSLAGRETSSKNSPEYGKILEHFIFTELRAFLDYRFLDLELNYWRSTSKMEVDFVIPLGNRECIGIEVKATQSPSQRDYKGLLALEEDVKLVKKIVVCQSEMKRKTKEGIIIYPIQEFLTDLWAGKIL